ncbi:DUF6090 family protein [Aegicerativicinus sediminis]|uniref:DUF6090 family protein n=1 Tax=Aegicerativicinus sediminis TaxID=2893202 RepID=UPI001E2FD149|nr:DUF6090 family protein [Aegicerativicinus sediminis]
MENKTSKYLKYAIGEIFLVVIGIIIALQINNWNEQRKLKFDEQEALVNIKEDFTYNKKLLLDVINESEETMQSSLVMLNYTGKKPKPEREQYFDSLVNKVITSPYYYPRNGFLDDLINSGNLSIFRSVDLRNRLSSWKPLIDRVQARYVGLRDYQDGLINYIIEHGSWLNADAMMTFERDIEFPESGFDVDNRTMLLDLKFENMIENNAIYLDNYRGELINAQKLLDSILALIDGQMGTTQ